MHSFLSNINETLNNEKAMYFISALKDFVISYITCLISYYLQLIADETIRTEDKTKQKLLLIKGFLLNDILYIIYKIISLLKRTSLYQNKISRIIFLNYTF